MKKTILLFFLATAASLGFAQNSSATLQNDDLEKQLDAKPHKIVFQLTSADTNVHKSLMRQLNNILSVAHDSKMEVVCHGPGLDLLVIGKTIVQEKIAALKAAGVIFVACEFAMKERKVEKDKIIPEAGFVKAGVLEIVSKQEEGWSYIKLGF